MRADSTESRGEWSRFHWEQQGNLSFRPNQLMGDAKLSSGQRRTRTNVTKFDQPKGDAHYSILMPSGLLGPVRLERIKLPAN